MMPGVNYVIYGCSYARTTPEYHYSGASHWKETLLQLLDRVIDDNLKRQIKNRILCTI